ncbi:MAG: MFS transporter [Comamonas sp.]
MNFDMKNSWKPAVFAGCLLGATLGLIEGFSLFIIPISSETSIARNHLTTLYAAHLLFSAIFSPLLGQAINKIPPKGAIATSFTLISLAFLLCSKASNIYHLYIAYTGILAPAFSLSVLTAHHIINAHYTSKTRGRAFSIVYSCLGSIGFILLSLQGSMIDTFGWRNTYTLSSLLSISLIPLLIKASSIIRYHINHIKETTSTHHSPPSKIIRPPLKVWFICLAAFIASAADFLSFQNLAPLLISNGSSTSLAGFSLGIMALGFTAGQVISGPISDKYTREFSSTVATILSTLSICILIGEFPSLTTPACFFLGFGIGGIISSRVAAGGDVSEGNQLGSNLGVIQFFSAMGASFGVWVGGFVFGIKNNYSSVFIITAIFSVAWLIPLWLAAPRRLQKSRRIFDSEFENN